MAITAAQASRRVYYGTLGTDRIADGSQSRRRTLPSASGPHPSRTARGRRDRLPARHPRTAPCSYSSSSTPPRAALVQQPIDKGCGHDLVAKDAAPFLEALVGGKHGSLRDCGGSRPPGAGSNGCGSGTRRGTASGGPPGHTRSPRPVGLYPLETSPLKVKTVHQGIYETNRILRAHPVVYGIRQTRLLRTIIT